MREVIARVVETETAARKIVADARAEAERIVADAKRLAHETESRIHDETRAEVAAILSAAAQDAGRQKQDRVAKAASEIESQIRLDQAMRQQTVNAAVQCICGGPSRGK